jgi:hypothetical protein
MLICHVFETLNLYLRNIITFNVKFYIAQYPTISELRTTFNNLSGLSNDSEWLLLITGPSRYL